MPSFVNPTRMELSRQKRRLQTARKGHKLLKDKQDEMARQFMLLIRKNRQLRMQVEGKLSDAVSRFSVAQSVMGEEQVEQAFLIPVTQIEISTASKNIMGVEVPTLKQETEGDGSIDLPYGFANTSGLLDRAVMEMAELYPLLIELAECEKACDMLAAELERTRRRVNALEHIMIPETQSNIRMISMKLEENERSSIVRLMKVKQMLAQRQNAAN